MRVILDTNIWISFLISKKLDWLDELLINENFVFLFSELLFKEFLDVADRPKIRKYFKTKKLIQVINYFESYGEIIHTSTSLNICRDPRDNFLLDLAVDGQANYLVSGDEDLLTLKSIKKCNIISLKQFKEIAYE